MAVPAEPFSPGSRKHRRGQFHKLRLVNQKGKEIPSYNAVCSAMRGLSVSDSLPVDASCLTLCQKLDVGPSGGISSRVPMMRECLKPGTELHAALTLDDCFLREAGMDRQFLVEAIQEFYALQKPAVRRDNSMGSNMKRRNAGACSIWAAGAGSPAKRSSSPCLGMHRLLAPQSCSPFCSRMATMNPTWRRGFPAHAEMHQMGRRLVPMGKCEVAVSMTTSIRLELEETHRAPLGGGGRLLPVRLADGAASTRLCRVSA